MIKRDHDCTGHKTLIYFKFYLPWVQIGAQFHHVLLSAFLEIMLDTLNNCYVGTVNGLTSITRLGVLKM